MGDWMDVKIGEAMARGASELTPAVVGARYDSATGKVIVDLENGCAFLFPARSAQGLERASDEQLAHVEIQGVTGLHWDDLDVDLSVPHLMEGLLGTRAFMNREHGRRGGQATSEAKASAARANGALGGRPRKVTAEPSRPTGGSSGKDPKPTYEEYRLAAKDRGGRFHEVGPRGKSGSAAPKPGRGLSRAPKAGA